MRRHNKPPQKKVLFFSVPQINSLPKDKILYRTTKFWFADDNLNFALMMISLFDGVKLSWEKEKILVFGTVFSKAFLLKAVKSRDSVVKS